MENKEYDKLLEEFNDYISLQLMRDVKKYNIVVPISDKNLGATVVWNQWDSVTDANCGYFYQWGNNYWFPHSWSLPATTTSQVNASAYWPSNPYSSNVYYTGWLSNWDNSWNTNLWWWVNPSTYDYVEIDGDRYPIDKETFKADI